MNEKETLASALGDYSNNMETGECSTGGEGGQRALTPCQPVSLLLFQMDILQETHHKSWNGQEMEES